MGAPPAVQERWSPARSCVCSHSSLRDAFMLRVINPIPHRQLSPVLYVHRLHHLQPAAQDGCVREHNHWPSLDKEATIQEIRACASTTVRAHTTTTGRPRRGMETWVRRGQPRRRNSGGSGTASGSTLHLCRFKLLLEELQLLLIHMHLVHAPGVAACRRVGRQAGGRVQARGAEEGPQGATQVQQPWPHGCPPQASTPRQVPAAPAAPPSAPNSPPAASPADVLSRSHPRVHLRKRTVERPMKVAGPTSAAQ